MVFVEIVSNVGIAIIINLAFWDGLHQPFMVFFGLWFTIAIASVLSGCSKR